MRAPSPSERQIQKAVVDLLRRACDKKWRYTAIPLGEYRMKATAGQLKAAGVMAGWPDLMFVGPKKMFFLELKKKGGRLSPAQVEIGGHIHKCGFEYVIADTIEDAIDHLTWRGILRGVEVL